MATAQQAISDAIYAKLIAITTAGTFYAALGGRIYDTFTPISPTLPFALINIISDPVQPYFTDDGLQLDFQIDVYGRMDTSAGGPKVTRAIGDLGYALLHRAALTVTGYAGCSILCQTRAPGLEEEFIAGGGTQQDAYRDSRTYRLFGTGTA